jgi:hypothetical protein
MTPLLLAGARLVLVVETNIVRFRLRGIPATEFVEEAHR